MLERFSALLVVALKLKFLISCWPKTTLNSLLCESFHRAAHNKIAGFIQVNKERESASQRSLLARQKPWSLVTDLRSENPSLLYFVYKQVTWFRPHSRMVKDSRRQGLLSIIA